jgi:hypothetical protein
VVKSNDRKSRFTGDRKQSIYAREALPRKGLLKANGKLRKAVLSMMMGI